MFVTRPSRLAVAFVALAAMPALAQDEAAAETVVATVDGTEITLGHMIAMREQLPPQYQNLDDATLFQGILEQLIQQTALGTLSDETSARTELTLENERRALVAAEVLDNQVTDIDEAAIEARYNETFGQATGETEYNASHILVETEEEAQALLEQLEGGADFAELARAESVGPSGPSGGELGWFGPGRMVPAFDEAVQAMEAGQIEGPVETQFGFHVIRLNETRTAEQPPLDEVRGEIEQTLQQESMSSVLDGAMEQADIQRNDSGMDAGVIRDDTLLDG